jgi:hypothetical protein
MTFKNSTKDFEAWKIKLLHKLNWCYFKFEQNIFKTVLTFLNMKELYIKKELYQWKDWMKIIFVFLDIKRVILACLYSMEVKERKEQ